MADKISDPAYPPRDPPQGAPPAYHANAGEAPTNCPPQGYGAPPQSYGPPPVIAQPVSTTTVVTTGGPGYVPVFREVSVNTTCPACHGQINTQTSYKVGTCTWVSCLVLFFIGCDIGCCLIPFCVPACKDVLHTCPNCSAQVGIFKRM